MKFKKKREVNMTKTEKAISWMEQTANDNTHGYSQSVRWGPSYDCSSMVITAWQNAGVPVKDKGATFTGNMYEAFLLSGFDDVTGKVSLSSGSGLIRGDVLLNDANHTAMYCGNGEVVHARSSEGTSDTADNSGNEIRIQPYWNYPWNHVLRYKETEANDSEDKVEEGTTEEAETYVIPSPDISYDETDISDIPNATHSTSSSEPVNLIEIKNEAKVKELSVHVCRGGEYSWFVEAMQYLLKANAYWAQADANFGIDTARWLIKFQREHPPLEVDCECGYNTWNELFKDKVLMITDEGYAVKALEYLLRAQNYYIGDGDADGIFGPNVYKQVRRFQKKRGITVNGIVDSDTWNELIKI